MIRSLEIIGKAVKNIPQEIKEKYPNIPWKKMAGMGDKLIHGYFGVDNETIWQTIKFRIPEIKPIIEFLVDATEIGEPIMEQKKEQTEGLVGKVFNLSNLVEYQEGAVVSRTVVKQNTGTVTLFSFDQGQGLSEHTAPFDAMVCILDGEAEVIISGESNLVKAGEMIIMPAGKPHALKATKRFKMLLIMIRS